MVAHVVVTMKRIGFCSGPLDVAHVRTYFATKKIKIAVTDLLEIKADFVDADRARDVYLELRSRDCWLEKELECMGHYEQYDD